MYRHVDDLITIRRLARPGRRDARWRRSMELAIQGIVNRTWPLRRAEMLASPPIRVADHQAAAWAALDRYLDAGQSVHRGVYFLGNGSAVVAVYEPDAPRYERYVPEWGD